MKRILLLGTLAVGLTLGVQAQETAGAWLDAHSSSRLADLTIGDLTALARAESVSAQQEHYVFRAGLSSFLLPGVGQFETGDVTGGILHLTGQAALAAATLYSAWSLLPSDLRASGLSRDERRSLVEGYRDSDPGKLVPSVLVMAGGLTLSVVHSLWASGDAKAQARANIADGKVTFEPRISTLGMGMGMRY